MKNTIFRNLFNGFKVREPAKKTPAEQKKCKSCAYFGTVDECKYPLHIACADYQKRRKK